jgi:hypothetical protein
LLSPLVLAQFPDPEPRIVPRSFTVLKANFPAAVGYEPVTDTTGALNLTVAAVDVVIAVMAANEYDDGEMLVGVQ